MVISGPRGPQEGREAGSPTSLPSFGLNAGRCRQRTFSPAPISSVPTWVFVKILCDTQQVQASHFRMTAVSRRTPHVWSVCRCCPGLLATSLCRYPSLPGNSTQIFLRESAFPTFWIQEVFTGAVPPPGFRPGSSAYFTTQATVPGSWLAQARLVGPVSLSSRPFCGATRKAVGSWLQDKGQRETGSYGIV